jgi:hypothetical protein
VVLSFCSPFVWYDSEQKVNLQGLYEKDEKERAKSLDFALANDPIKKAINN